MTVSQQYVAVIHQFSQQCIADKQHFPTASCFNISYQKAFHYDHPAFSQNSVLLSVPISCPLISFQYPTHYTEHS